MPISDEMRKMILDFASTGSYDALIAAIEKLEAENRQLVLQVYDLQAWLSACEDSEAYSFYRSEVSDEQAKSVWRDPNAN